MKCRKPNLLVVILGMLILVFCGGTVVILGMTTFLETNLRIVPGNWWVLLSTFAVFIQATLGLGYYYNHR
jgi:hypothetical protein